MEMNKYLFGNEGEKTAITTRKSLKMYKSKILEHLSS